MLKYTATVGMMPIKNREGDTEARIFWALSIAQAASPTDKTFARNLQAAEMLDALGGKNVQIRLNEQQQPGYGIHEVGTARMGADAGTSVLNQF